MILGESAENYLETILILSRKKGNVRSKLIFVSFAGERGSTVICIVRGMFKVNQTNG